MNGFLAIARTGEAPTVQDWIPISGVSFTRPVGELTDAMRDLSAAAQFATESITFTFSAYSDPRSRRQLFRILRVAKPKQLLHNGRKPRG